MAFKSTGTYKYCPQCGGSLERRIIKSGGPERLVCLECNYVLYDDPNVAVIAVVPKDGGVVMTRRAVDPGYGLWVLPGGFVDVAAKEIERLLAFDEFANRIASEMFSFAHAIER